MWKGVFGFDNYLCNEQGEIYSLKRNKILKGTVNKQGYKCVLLTKNDGKIKRVRVHRIVAQTFIPNPENKPQINHKDGNKMNNAISNLEWVTSKENIHHAIKTGLVDNSGTHHGQATCNEEKLKEIRNLISEGKKDKEIEKITGIPFYTIGGIRKGKHYKEKQEREV